MSANPTLAVKPKSAPKSKSKSKRKHPRLSAPSKNYDDPDANVPSTGALRTAIRNLERLLRKAESMPADIRMEKERELNHYRLDLSERREREKRGRMVGKYHGVRFFERQKATRRLKKLRTQLKELDERDPKREALEQRVQEAEVDLNYTVYSPLAEKYVSLFVESAEDDEEESAKKRREKKPEWWFVVERAMKEDKLGEVREGRWPLEKVSRVTQIGSSGNMKENWKAKNGDKKVIGRDKRLLGKKSAVDEKDQEDTESDGDFFEE